MKLRPPLCPIWPFASLGSREQERGTKKETGFGAWESCLPASSMIPSGKEAGQCEGDEQRACHAEPSVTARVGRTAMIRAITSACLRLRAAAVPVPAPGLWILQQVSSGEQSWTRSSTRRHQVTGMDRN